MIIQFVFSLLVSLLCTIFCCIVSGGGFGAILVQWVLILGFLSILVLYSILSGNGRNLVNIFLTKQKYQNSSFQKLKSTELALDFLCKSTLYIGLFLMIFSCSYFFVNIRNTETLGKNLSNIILSLFYTIFIELILITIKSRITKDKILFMAEETNIKEKTQNNKNYLLSILKMILSIFVISSLFIYVLSKENFNESSYNLKSIVMWFDIPSLLELIIPSFLLLLISGNLPYFWQGIKIVFQNQKISVTEKNLMTNAIKTFRVVIILTGLACSLIGFVVMNRFLEDKSLLGINIHVSLIVSLYAVISNLILLPFEIKISNLAEEI